MRNAFWKGHGLGNDYLVIEPRAQGFRLTPRAVRLLCDRHQGVGADGVLVPTASRSADFGVRIYNPDGSEAEKSGNGLRILARYLRRVRRVRRRRFRVETRGGVVEIECLRGARGAERYRVAMGRASFRPAALPCTLRVPELVDRPIRAAGRSLRFTGVSVGNPHCVVFRGGRRAWTQELLRELGPRLETHRWFPRRVNVQLARPRGAHALDVRVWERGAGETQASGSSACAAACAGVRLGLVRSPVAVHMQGGVLEVEVGPDFDVTLTGPAEEVASGRLSDELVRRLRG